MKVMNPSVSPVSKAVVAGRLNGPSRICDVGLQDGDIITAIVREPGPVMESYRKVAVVARHGKICWGIIIKSFFSRFRKDLQLRKHQ